MEITVETIESLAKLLTAYKLDRIKIGDFEISKTKHESSSSASKQPVHNLTFPSDEELLFLSAGGITAEQLKELAVDPMPVPPVKKRSKKKDNI